MPDRLRTEVRELIAAGELTLRGLGRACGGSHALWRKVLAGAAGLDADRLALLEALVRDRGSRQAPTPYSQTPLALAMGRVLAKLNPSGIAAIAEAAGTDESSVRRWLRGERQAPGHLDALVTPLTVGALNPSLRLRPELEGRTWGGDPARDPDVLGLNLDHLVLVAERGPALPTWFTDLQRTGYSLLPACTTASGNVLPRLELRANQLRTSPAYALVVLVRVYSGREASETPVIARLYLKPRFSSIPSLRLELTGSAFAANRATAIIEEFFAPAAAPGTARVSGVDVALDVACRFDRVLEVYRGKGHQCSVWMSSEVATTYRRSGSKKVQLAVYDYIQEQGDSLVSGGRALLKARRRYPCQPGATRFEVRARQLRAVGVSTVEDLVASLPDLFGQWLILDVGRALATHGPTSLLRSALRLLQERGHAPNVGPSLLSAESRGLMLRATEAEEDAAFSSRRPLRRRPDRPRFDNQWRRRASDQVLAAALARGATTKRAEALATSFHAACNDALPRLAQSFPLFADLAGVIRAHSPALQRELEGLLAVANGAGLRAGVDT